MLSFMDHLQALSLLVLASLVSSAAPPPSGSGHRFTLTHIDSKGGFTKAELMRRAAHRSRLQAATGFSSSEAGPRLRSGQAEYLMELAIGTPPVPFVTLFDTGSDLTWTQCQPCKLCFPQDTPVPTASSSFSPLTCSSDACLPVWSRGCAPSSLCGYRYAYGDDSHSAGVLGTETLTFGSGPGQVPAPFAGAVAFGCGRDNGGDWYNSTGLVGLGRGSLSLVAQLGFEKFSYCLTDFYNTSLGSHGISLGDARLPIPNQSFELHADGTGGMIVDSGTIFTVLVESAFRVVADHVAEVLGQPALNTTSLESPCFPAPAGVRQLPAMPDMVLHFAGGADMRLHGATTCPLTRRTPHSA
ncbi:hypothetical protein CFC21_034524 [Triticum aestivum]|uniref:Peptidase A1 domain-containing protein n=2 Tax=Triticum aestivum TaxID=4565 RepID=A0A3B6EC91_WHEAT|nr:hypothetical protein CFC21_034524 [Triticum aestivum]